MTKKNTDDMEQKLAELTADVQRTRADFENYRKRVESEKLAAQQLGQTKAIMKVLPLIDTIDRAVANVPDDIVDNSWVKGVTSLQKQLQKQLESLNIKKIDAKPGTKFNPEFHQAVQFDDESEGETEIIAEELQPGYTLDGSVIRDAIVKVARQ